MPKDCTGPCKHPEYTDCVWCELGKPWDKRLDTFLDTGKSFNTAQSLDTYPA